MSNPISSIFSGSPSLDKASLEKTKKRALDTSFDANSASAKAAQAAPAAQADKLELSEIAQRAKSEPAFDRAKVESIKQAIQDGSYPLNSRRIAESFVAMEKLIG
jgi:negative regulator of flagellin synthesis FlgM